VRLRSGSGEELDETGELAGEIRQQRLARGRRALVQARLQLQKVVEFLPEGTESRIAEDDLTLEQVDEAMARWLERLDKLA
jgi:hypothetical protein